MARNSCQFWIALLAAGLFVGCWGCEPPKKADNAGKKQSSSETSKPESISKNDEEPTPKPSEKTDQTTEPVETSAKTPVETAAKPPEDTSAKPQDDNPPPVPAPTPSKPTKANTPSKTVKQELPPPAAIPKVSLTDKLRATCLVKVGDDLPEAELAGLDGNKVALKSLYGDALTVVIFWNAGGTVHSRQSVVEALGDMQKDVLEPFAAKELKVVGINVGDKPDDAKKSLNDGGAAFPNLLDPDRGYFKSVATEKLPRVYLLDAAGKILWFDLEYARATRRELLTAIKAVLEGKK